MCPETGKHRRKLGRAGNISCILIMHCFNWAEAEVQLQSLQVSCLSRNKFASAKVETVTVPETEPEIRSLALWNLQLVFVMVASLESNCQVCALSLLFWLSHDLCLIN